jgi:hypothetical protein
MTLGRCAVVALLASAAGVAACASRRQARPPLGAVGADPRAMVAAVARALPAGTAVDSAEAWLAREGFACHRGEFEVADAVLPDPPTALFCRRPAAGVDPATSRAWTVTVQYRGAVVVRVRDACHRASEQDLSACWLTTR